MISELANFSLIFLSFTMPEFDLDLEIFLNRSYFNDGQYHVHNVTSMHLDYNIKSEKKHSCGNLVSGINADVIPNYLDDNLLISITYKKINYNPYCYSSEILVTKYLYEKINFTWVDSNFNVTFNGNLFLEGDYLGYEISSKKGYLYRRSGYFNETSYFSKGILVGDLFSLGNQVKVGDDCNWRVWDKFMEKKGFCSSFLVLSSEKVSCENIVSCWLREIMQSLIDPSVEMMSYLKNLMQYKIEPLFDVKPLLFLCLMLVLVSYFYFEKILNVPLKNFEKRNLYLYVILLLIFPSLINFFTFEDSLVDLAFELDFKYFHLPMFVFESLFFLGSYFLYFLYLNFRHLFLSLIISVYPIIFVFLFYMNNLRKKFLVLTLFFLFCPILFKLFYIITLNLPYVNSLFTPALTFNMVFLMNFLVVKYA